MFPLRNRLWCVENRMLPINFSNTLPQLFWEQLEKSASKFLWQERWIKANEERGRRSWSQTSSKGDTAQQGMCSPLSLSIATSLGLMKVQGTKVMDRENETLFYTQPPSQIRGGKHISCWPWFFLKWSLPNYSVLHFSLAGLSVPRIFGSSPHLQFLCR